jgi:predicted chitinase
LFSFDKNWRVVFTALQMFISLKFIKLKGMADEKKSIFDLADKFGVVSPFGNWVKEDFKQAYIYKPKILSISVVRSDKKAVITNPNSNKIPIYILITAKIEGEENVVVTISCDGGSVPDGSIQINNKNRDNNTGILSYEVTRVFFISIDKNAFQPKTYTASVQITSVGKIADKKEQKFTASNGQISQIEDSNIIASNKIDKLSEEQISSISSTLKKENVKKHLEGINEAIEDNNINTCLRASNFLAQILHESGGLRLTKEGGVSESDYGGFIGRGLIQITGESNYKKYQEFSGEDVTSSLENKKKLENPPHSGKSAGWFWDISNLNPLADKNDFIMITRTINGGFNHYDDRLKYLKGALKSICKKAIAILDFKSSKAYNDKRASFAWGLWHDPDINKKGCTKDKNKAIEGYQRFIDILPKDYKQYNWYEIKSISAFQSIKGTNSAVDVKKAAELRLKELKK